MEEANEESTGKSDAPRGIGTLAARKRQQLERFDQERKRVQEKLREERDQLARDVAEVEGRDRRRRRNREMKGQKKVKFILGGMVFAALRERGRDALSITAMDLDGLKPLERQLVDQALDAAQAASSLTADASRVAKQMPDDPVDVVL
jgi:hypothetical protein